MLKIDGTVYDRVFVCELEPGMVNAFGETVADVAYGDNSRVRIKWNDGRVEFQHAETTMLIDVATIND